MQKEDLNGYGQAYIERFPEMKIKIVDGSSLVAAIVLNSIPKGINKVLLRGNLNKVSFAIANALSKINNVQVATLYKHELDKLHDQYHTHSNAPPFTISTHHFSKVYPSISQIKYINFVTRSNSLQKIEFSKKEDYIVLVYIYTAWLELFLGKPKVRPIYTRVQT